jgi:hypothetical protein
VRSPQDDRLGSVNDSVLKPNTETVSHRIIARGASWESDAITSRCLGSAFARPRGLNALVLNVPGDAIENGPQVDPDMGSAAFEQARPQIEEAAMAELVALAFDDVQEADRVMAELNWLQKEYVVDLVAAVVAVRSREGKAQLANRRTSPISAAKVTATRNRASPDVPQPAAPWTSSARWPQLLFRAVQVASAIASFSTATSRLRTPPYT